MPERTEYLIANYFAAHQPNFFPRLKVVSKIWSADSLWVMDDVQYSSREWQNRALISHMKLQTSHWLTLPVRRPAGQRTKIRAVEIVEPVRTRTRIVDSIWHAYRRSPYWSDVARVVEITYQNSPTGLSELANASLTALWTASGRTMQTVHMPDASIFETSATTRLANAADAALASHYIAGSGSLRYMTSLAWTSESMVIAQDWHPPEGIAKTGGLDWSTVSYLDTIAEAGVLRLVDYLECEKNRIRRRLDK